MVSGRTGLAGDQTRNDSATGSRPVNLEGDSPELVAFALLRYLAQLEQGVAHETGIVFDREWLLDAYADCLKAVRGERDAAPKAAASSGARKSAAAPAKAARGRTSRR